MSLFLGSHSVSSGSDQSLAEHRSDLAMYPQSHHVQPVQGGYMPPGAPVVMGGQPVQQITPIMAPPQLQPVAVVGAPINLPPLQVRFSSLLKSIKRGGRPQIDILIFTALASKILSYRPVQSLHYIMVTCFLYTMDSICVPLVPALFGVVRSQRPAVSLSRPNSQNTVFNRAG
jgi:hypothetical protein